MKRRDMQAVVTLMVALVAWAGSGPARAQTTSADMTLMPYDSFTGAWKKSGTPRTYTSADLYGYIDGGAELFLELGFEQLTIQRYKDGTNELGVEVYRMADAAAARAVFLSRAGKPTLDPSLNARHTVSKHQLQLQRGRYYVIVNNISGAVAVTPALVGAAEGVAKAIGADGSVPALALLPKAGLVPNSERLIRGTYTLQAVFTLGEGDMLSLGGKLTAAAGDYRDATGTTTLIVAEYPTPAAAQVAFAYLKGHLDRYLKPTVTTATKLGFQDYEKKFGVATLAGARLEIRLHLTTPPA
jgi:hypothetical protein